MSGSSLITAGMQPDTIDTIDPQSTAKTQQSVSTIGSRYLLVLVVSERIVVSSSTI